MSWPGRDRCATIGFRCAADLHDPFIAKEPEGRTATAGQAVTFTVAANGTPPVTYQWQRDGKPIPGATTATCSVGPVGPADHGAAFTCLVSGRDGVVPTAPAKLTITER